MRARFGREGRSATVLASCPGTPRDDKQKPGNRRGGSEGSACDAPLSSTNFYCALACTGGATWSAGGWWITHGSREKRDAELALLIGMIASL
jgi:hypothetical protein